MANILLDLLKFNESINYTSIITMIVLYLVFFWGAISVWVFVDARKRVRNRLLPFLLALINFLLLPPFLILYILLRPELKEEYSDFVDGGVNIPIVNFMGKDRQVALSFELRINSRELAAKNDTEMKIDINFDSNDPEKILAVESNRSLDLVRQAKTAVVARKSLSDRLRGKLVGLKSLMFKPKQETEKVQETEKQDTTSSQPQQDQTFLGKKQKKHKRRRH